MEQFKVHGKAETPVAVIQDGTRPTQRSIVGTVSTITALSAIEKAGSPAIIIVGEVVRFGIELDKIINNKILKNYE
jgi:uroporphyrin-III C-methyltransferase